MATRTLAPARQCLEASGADPFVIELDEAATQTFKIGGVLGLNSSGYVAEIASVSDATAKVVGVALRGGQSGTAAGDKKSSIVVARPDTIFEANLYHGTANSAIASRMYIGRTFPMKKINNNWHIDIETAITASNRLAMVVGFNPDDVIGTDIYHRARFVFLSDKCALSATS